MSANYLVTIKDDDAGQRLDRWFKQYYPGLGFGQLQKLLRSGQVRLDGKRVKTSTRIETGNQMRVPPQLSSGEVSSRPIGKQAWQAGDADYLNSMIIHEDKHVIVLNKPFGLAVQGGSGLSRHVDGLLESRQDKNGQKPRLVHRLDRDTSGVLLIAKTKMAAREMTAAFRKRTTKKTYWAIVKGVPKPLEAKISTYLAKEATDDGDRMRVVGHGAPGADHAVTHFRVIEKSGERLSWVELSPVTGRTHQLRIHTQYIGTPILGDPKYFDIENWELPGGIQNKLHLHARRISLPHPAPHLGMPVIDISAPLPDHMVQTFNLLGLDEENGDPVEEY